MNIVTIENPSHLTADISLAMGGLEGLRYDLRVARMMLDKARLDRAATWRYRGADAIGFRQALARRINRCLEHVRTAQANLDEAQQLADLRRAQAARPVGMSAAQVAYCIKTMGDLTAWIDRLNLSKPADDDYHARLLMRDNAAGIRDLLLNVAVHSIAIMSN